MKAEVACIKIDGCVFKTEDGIKCDYLFEVDNLKKLYFVELKGTDIIKGIRQIYETVRHLQPFYPNWVYEARIVSRNVPAAINDRNEKEKLKKICNGGRVTVHENRHIETF